jgi:hypothetical protein
MSCVWVLSGGSFFKVPDTSDKLPPEHQKDGWGGCLGFSLSMFLFSIFVLGWWAWCNVVQQPPTWSMPMSHDIMMLPLETMWTTYHFCFNGRYNSIRDNVVYMKDDKGILGYVQCGILGDVGFHSRSTNS